MSDSGVWGISQEYFDKVYPQQEKRRRKNFRVPVLAEQGHTAATTVAGGGASGARESTTFDCPSVTKADSCGSETPFFPDFL